MRGGDSLVKTHFKKHQHEEENFSVSRYEIMGRRGRMGLGKVEARNLLLKGLKVVLVFNLTIHQHRRARIGLLG